MLEQRNVKLDLVALVLLALVAFLALSLATYNRSDPPLELVRPLDRYYPIDQPVYPLATTTANACGRFGALVADLMFHGLGLGAYFVVFSLAVLDALLLARRQINEPYTRAVGWAMTLVGFTTFIAIAAPQVSPGPVIGAGGYLGAAGRGLLEMNFATVGAYILTFSLTLAGMLLCTDYLVLRLAAWTVGMPTKGLLRTGRVVMQRGKAKPMKPARKSDTDDDLNEDLSVKIRGKRVNEEEEDAEEEESEELEDEVGDDVDEADESDEIDEEDEKEKPGPVGMRQRLAAALGLSGNRRNEREEVIQELEAASRTEDTFDYELPSIDMLLQSDDVPADEHEKEVRQKAKVLEKTFADFGFKVKVVEIETGPVIAQYEVELEAGLRLSKITSLADDLAIALRVPSVRIVAPIPGKNTVGIEIPNSQRQIVRMREVIEEANGRVKKMRIPMFIGKDVSGNPLVVDLATLPHLLIAGRTGTGKSVCLNSIIVSMLMMRRPDEVKMLMIDPKMVELSPYKNLPHLMHPVVTDMRKAEAILGWAVEKMEERYALLARAGVRHISVYNQLGEEELMDRLQPETDEERAAIPRNLPYIVMVADEMADLMMTCAKEVEAHIIRLAQKSRAVGIHLVLATQKPTVDVITGLIKSNLPARIAFQVASRTDSRVVLDEMGAERLLGNGDMLFLWPGTSTILRGQGTYLSDDEINRIVDAVSTSEPQYVKELVQLKPSQPGDANAERLKNRDELYEAAVDIVIREGRGSVSLLQRALGIGYGRAARLIDFMAEDGIVGQYNGSQAREVVISIQQWEAMQSAGASAVPAAPAPVAPAAPAPSRPKRNVILPEGRAERTATPITNSALVEEEEAPFNEDEIEDEEDELEDEVDEDEIDEEDDLDEDEEDSADEYEEDEDDSQHPAPKRIA